MENQFGIPPTIQEQMDIANGGKYNWISRTHQGAHYRPRDQKEEAEIANIDHLKSSITLIQENG
jgi:hypothetical protein